MLNTVSTETRRKSARTKVAGNEIIYLHFQTGNGAIALDASAEGFGFQAADPLHPNESLTFRLSVPGFADVDLSGQIAWLDSTRKRGGLRLNVPAESIAIFSEWQRKYLEPAPENEQIPAAQPEPEPTLTPEPSSAASGNAVQTPNPEPAAIPSPGSSSHGDVPESQTIGQPEPPPISAPPANPFARQSDSLLGSHGPIFVSEWELPPEPSRTGRNVLIACVIIALCIVIAGGSYYFAGKREVGDMLIRLGRQIGGAAPQATTTPAASPIANTGTATVPSAGTGTADSLSSPPAPNAAATNPAGNVPPRTAVSTSQHPVPPNVPQVPSAANSAAAVPPVAASQIAQQSIASAGGAANALNSTQVTKHNGTAGAAAPPMRDSHPHAGSIASLTPQAAKPASSAIDNGAADLKQALQYLSNPDSQDSAVAAELLWSAVGKGNTQAELVLGSLYLRGQGAVHRNCQQAEVLLNAALAANVPGADEKIHELQTYGCR